MWSVLISILDNIDLKLSFVTKTSDSRENINERSGWLFKMFTTGAFGNIMVPPLFYNPLRNKLPATERYINCSNWYLYCSTRCKNGATVILPRFLNDLCRSQPMRSVSAKLKKVVTTSESSMYLLSCIENQNTRFKSLIIPIDPDWTFDLAWFMIECDPCMMRCCILIILLLLSMVLPD